MNRELLFEIEVDAQDRHGEVVIEKVVEAIIQDIFDLSRRCSQRNGPNSIENETIKRVNKAISQYFQIEEDFNHSIHSRKSNTE